MTLFQNNNYCSSRSPDVLRLFTFASLQLLNCRSSVWPILAFLFKLIEIRWINSTSPHPPINKKQKTKETNSFCPKTYDVTLHDFSLHSPPCEERKISETCFFLNVCSILLSSVNGFLLMPFSDFQLLSVPKNYPFNFRVSFTSSTFLHF